MPHTAASAITETSRTGRYSAPSTKRVGVDEVAADRVQRRPRRVRRDPVVLHEPWVVVVDEAARERRGVQRDDGEQRDDQQRPTGIPTCTLEDQCAARWYSAACHSAAVGNILVVDDEQLDARVPRDLPAPRRPRGRRRAERRPTRSAQLRAQPFDVVITDLQHARRAHGLGAARRRSRAAASARRRVVDPEVILVTAFATAETAIAAMKQGAYDYLTKPFKVDEITAVIEPRAREAALRRARTSRCASRSPGRVRLANLLGKSRAMQQVFELVAQDRTRRRPAC